LALSFKTLHEEAVTSYNFCQQGSKVQISFPGKFFNPFFKERGAAFASRQTQHAKKLVDSGGGFFIEESEEEEGLVSKESQQADRPAPMLGPDRPDCSLCEKPFGDSYLFRQSLSVRTAV
jgi:hypothetical protein